MLVISSDVDSFNRSISNPYSMDATTGAVCYVHSPGAGKVRS